MKISKKNYTIRDMYSFRGCTALTSVIFEEPANWYESEDTLSDPNKAAEYLISAVGQKSGCTKKTQ